MWVVGEGAQRQGTGGLGAAETLPGPQWVNYWGGAGGGLQGSPGSVLRDSGGWGGREPGLCSFSTGSLGLGLPDLEIGRLGGGPRLTQQCLGAGWESLILPGKDGGPCPCVSGIFYSRPSAGCSCSPPIPEPPHTPWNPLHLESRVLQTE